MASKTAALKALYEALGGTASNVSGCTTSLEVLNKILALGSVDAVSFIGDAIAEIAENASAILPAPKLQNKEVTPSTSQQTITKGSNYDGLGTVTVKAVTAAIDENIVAGNIKSGVTILGVEGTYTGA